MNPKINNINKISIGQKITVSNSTATNTTTTAQKTTIKATSTATPTNTSKINKLVAASKTYLGRPYRYGASTATTNYFDCSSFVQRIFKDIGVSLPRTTTAQAKVGKQVSISNLKVGDLIFFATGKKGVISHVGMYVGNGQMINAQNSYGVSYANINSSYWKPRIVKATRVL